MSGVARRTYRIVDDADDERAARTPRDVLLTAQLLKRNFKAVTTGAWIMKNLLLVVKLHVFELDLIVV